ncbi:OmpA family protein [Novosphingobium sp. Gsoil 351]|uniref:OmpA family protein n=1 Tax=Novosphingobium sp. Gsoil 351 TaxID=2675225 RepID=UPI0018A83C4F|nr:OmpA family protein [Novosphingobium sp. Gsoil 351]
MTVRIIIAAGALLASTSAWAQAAPGADQTTEDLVCQLSDKCADAVPSPADQADPAAAGPADRAAPRISATRGFKIARKVEAPAASSSSGYTAVRPATPGKAPSRIAYDSGKKVSAPAAGKSRPMIAANNKVIPKGRADLRVTFVTGSAELTEAGQREAQKFAAALSSPLLQGMRFTIEGHTDSVGSRAANQELSRRRAAAVVDYLVGKGADRARFDAVGYGADRPLDGISPTAALNRRVEVVRNK